MAPKMKAMAAAMKSTQMTKGALADALAAKCELKKAVASKVIASLAEIGTKEVKKSGVFTVPGLCRIKTRNKPATKAGKRVMFCKESNMRKSGVFTIPGLGRIQTRNKPATRAGKRVMFGKEVKVAAKPAKTVVKAFPVAALKSEI